MEAEFDAKLDPPLYKACKASIAAGCQHDVIARSGEFYSILDCLKDGLQKGRITDRECAEQVSTQEKSLCWDKIDSKKIRISLIILNCFVNKTI